MSSEGFEAFIASTTAPATAVPEMVDLFQRKPPWATGDNNK
jgi:hypothetical protein